MTLKKRIEISMAKNDVKNIKRQLRKNQYEIQRSEYLIQMLQDDNEELDAVLEKYKSKYQSLVNKEMLI